ncbi:efflux RND transporter periplasmic adaptor subunit [Ideonella livida]|uniref:Efflux RND transporter periplasmic adaptor subunit n=1 Tax=Ideonella livida TaxID=2707176 RepID=A0A7C9PG73_9BURK|nr:efflux RND transporter periplasmic adaptor subunit [Ideonella livida]NDY90731.1 efflux RND transporter periplasmic adaptor subunit [Ideonella livida]
MAHSLSPTHRTAGLLALTALALVACAPKAVPPEPVRAVRLLTVGQADAVRVSEFPGEVKARIETRLSFRVPGKLLQRPAQLGETVRAGQVLAQLDPADLRLGRDAAQAGVRAADVALQQALADLQRARELKGQGFVSAAEVERRETAWRSAQAQWEQARAQAQVQDNQSAYAQLTAPEAGVIAGIEAEPGQVLAAGTAVLRLAHDGPRDAVFQVPETRYQEFRRALGQPGLLRWQAWGEADSRPVTLRELAAAADPVTRTFLAKADIGREAVLGQSGTLRLPQVTAAAAIRVPLTAVLADKGRSAVWVLDGASMTVALRPVELGGSDGNQAIVSQGLKPGEEIVTAGTHVLTAGQKVRRMGDSAVGPSTASASAQR